MSASLKNVNFSFDGLEKNSWKLLKKISIGQVLGFVNVAAYDSNGNKLGNDVVPSGGAYALTVNIAGLAKGTNVLSIQAFSLAAGQLYPRLRCRLFFLFDS